MAAPEADDSVCSDAVYEVGICSIRTSEQHVDS